MTELKTQQKVENVEAINAMNSELQVERDYIFNTLSRRASRELREDYDLGVKIKNICDNPTLYGKDGMVHLIASLKLYENLLYALRSFATTYSEQDVQELQALNTPEGTPFPWTINHIRLLCQIRRRNQRQAMQVRCASEGWSIRQLDKAVKSILPDDGKGKSTGRVPTKPKGIDGYLETFGDMTSVWVDRVSRFGEDMVETIESNDKWSKDQKRKLNRLVDSLEAMTEKASVVLRELSSIKQQLDKVAEKQSTIEVEEIEDNEFKRTLSSYDEDIESSPRRTILAEARSPLPSAPKIKR